MAHVLIALTTSVDGFIADADDGVDDLFRWYFDGDTTVQPYLDAEEAGAEGPQFRLQPANAAVFQDVIDGVGAVVTGRRTYEVSGAWGGQGPIPGRPLFVVTHEPPAEVPSGPTEYTFVTEGVERAVELAGEAAGDRAVYLMGSHVPQACLRAGLVDEIRLHVAPVLLGKGVRLFDHLDVDPVHLEVIDVVDGPGVTHLRYRVGRGG